MTGFSWTPQNTDSDPVEPSPADQDIACDGWWPSINLADVRTIVRLDTTVTPQKLRDGVYHAMIEIALEPAMAEFRARQIALGYTSLSAVPGRIEVDDRSDYEHRWQRAVLSVVGADLGERQLGQSLTAAGIERAQAVTSDTDLHRRNVVHAVRQFLGKPKIRASVI